MKRSPTLFSFFSPLLFALSITVSFPAAIEAQVPSPEEFFGVRPGTSGVLITWDRLVDYYRTVAEMSPRVDFSVVGEATEGSPFVMLLISSAPNIARAEEYRQIQQRLADPRTWEGEDEKKRLAGEGLAVVMHNAAIHATEVGAHQAPPLLVYELATSNDPEVLHILENVMVVMVPSHNPDGTVKVTEWWNAHAGKPWRTSLPFLYQKYTGHDNNRDWYTFFQKESQLTLEVHNAWHPQLVIDQHQQGSNGSRIFVPPFEDPVEPNVDPILVSWLSAVGPFVGAYFNTRGLTGVEWGRRYDAWSPARAYHHYKGGIRVLTEVASASWADPVTTPPESLNPWLQTMHTNFPEPWTGGEWRFEDIVQYHYLSAKALMLFAANNRRQLVEGFAAYHERSLAYQGPPQAFLIPADQPNLYEVGEMLDILTRAEVEVVVAREEFRADLTRIPAGTYLIDIRQPYGRFAKAVLEDQAYPDLRLYEGGPPDPPYDVTGHTLPLLMGVDVIEIHSWEGGRFDPISTTRPEGRVARGSGSHLAMSSFNTGTTIAANRLRAMDIPVYWAAREFRSGRSFPAGTVLVPDTDAARLALEEMADELSLVVTPVNPSLGTSEMIGMGRGRVGLLQSWFANIEAGWTEWVLEHYGFNYTIVRPADLADGRVLEELDALIVPGENERSVIRGWAEGEMPPEYVGGAGGVGISNLVRFVNRGGALLVWGPGVDWVAPAFNVYVTNGVQELPPDEFSIPGSILRGNIDTTLPVNYGLQKEAALWFRRDSSLLFEDPGTVIIARYGSHNLLMSGYALGAEHLRDHVAAGGVVHGSGAVVLFGFTPQYRAQSRNTLKMLFNTILGAGNPDGAARMLRAVR